MSVLEPGSDVPDFRLARPGGKFGRNDLAGATTIFFFYPTAFSSVCTDQFNLYEEVLPEIEERDARIFGVSCDSVDSQTAFVEKLGVSIPQLSDFEPKGDTCRAFGVMHPAGIAERAIVVIGPDLKVAWSYQAETPGHLPGANLLFDGLDAVEAAT